MTQAEEPATRASGPAQQGAAQEDAYDLSVLVANSEEIYQQPGFVVRGAADMEGLTGFVTKSALQAAIAKFLNQSDAGHPTGE